MKAPTSSLVARTPTAPGPQPATPAAGGGFAGQPTPEDLKSEKLVNTHARTHPPTHTHTHRHTYIYIYIHVYMHIYIYTHPYNRTLECGGSEFRSGVYCSAFRATKEVPELGVQDFKIKGSVFRL